MGANCKINECLDERDACEIRRRERKIGRNEAIEVYSDGKIRELNEDGAGF